MQIALTLQDIFAGGTFAGLVMVLTNLVKPYLERFPGLHPADPMHDSTVRLVALALNVGLAIALYALQYHLTGPIVAQLVLQAFLQWQTSMGLYQAATNPPSGNASVGPLQLGSTATLAGLSPLLTVPLPSSIPPLEPPDTSSYPLPTPPAPADDGGTLPAATPAAAAPQG